MYIGNIVGIGQNSRVPNYPYFLGDKLVAYYNAKPSYLTIDSNRKVSQLNDLSGNGHHLVQTDAAKRPVYNMVDRITFNSVTQQGLINTSIIPFLQDTSIGIYGIFQSTSNDVFLVNFCDTDGTAFMGLRNSTTLQWSGTANTGLTGIAMNRDNLEQVFGLQINRNTNLDVMEDLTITTVADTSTSLLSDLPLIDNFCVGFRALATPSYSSMFFKQLVITNTKLTTSELGQLAQYITDANTTYEKILVAELGQSNMEGRDGDLTNGAYPFTTGKGYFWNGSAQDFIKTTRDGVARGSHANYFCERYFDLTNETPVMIECATGGTGLTSTASTPNWSSSSTLRTDAETKIDSALTFYSRIAPDYALWAQGETDADKMDSDGTYTKAIVKAAMQDVIDWWQTKYPNVPFVISELGRKSSGETAGWTAVREVQNEIAAENTGVYIGFDGAKDFVAASKMYDTLHYNYLGLKDMGEGLAEFIATSL